MKSWLKYRLRTAAILLTATLLTTSCLQSDFDEPMLAGDTVKVSFNVGVDNDMVTRVGEGGSINSLLVAIYKQDGTFVSAEIDNATVTDGKISGNLDFELLRNQNYKAVFFAYNSTGYTVTDNFQTITANYGVSNPELLDAFRGAIDFTATANTSLSTTLTRAVALFVVGAKNENFKSGDVTLSLPSAPTAFSTLTGATSDTSNISLTFTPNGSYVDGNNAYTLLAMTYVLPGTIQPTITTVDGDKQVANAITFAANKRYNLLGDSLFVNFSWGGKIEITSLPAENVDSDGWIHIKTAEELAYLIKNGDNATVAVGANISSTRADGVKKYHICPGADLDMSMWENEDKPTTAVSFTNTIIDAGKWDEDAPTVNQTCEDGCYTIEGLTLANGIFGNANGVTVQNLNIKGATIGSNTAEGVGIIANTATGSLTLTNITVSGTVTGANKVGGLVGYISNSEGNEATISNCHSTATVTTNNESDKTNHEIFVGGLVGCFRGNTKDEVLTFEGNCSANETGYFTPFCDDEQACFNSDCTVTENLLGGEENCRGSVYYGESRFFYRWDGVRKVTPLTENSSTSIYSPYDLAYLQDRSDNFSKNIWFGNHIDLGSRVFTPIKTNTNLYGNSKVLYNLKVDTYQDENISGGGGLIRTISNGRSENLEFRGADIRILHVAEADGGTTGNAYCGTLAATVGANHTISNVDCYDGNIYAVCKTGGLVGRISYGTFNCSDCEVESYTITNYVVPENVFYEKFSNSVYIGDKTFSKKVSFITITAYLKNVNAAAEASFNPEGEVGGLIGFVGATSNINNCHTKNITIDATGQPDDKSGVKVTGKWGLTSSARNNLNATAAYTIAGRHVNQFIGDAKAEGTSTKITITNCTATNATYVREQNNHSYSGGTCDIVGCAYYIGGVATLDLSPDTEYPFGADKGSVKVNGTEILDKAKAVIYVADILF